MVRKVKQILKRLFFRPVLLRQEVLLRLALQENGLNPNELQISVDHDKGKSLVNGVLLDIKYPDSFYLKATSLLTTKKTISFYFNGYVDKAGGREKLLEPFRYDMRSKIILSTEGRIDKLKGQFNVNYYRDLSQSIYGLCPHQLNWPGSTADLWTYRFIECCFSGSIPLLFKETPLGDKFTRGFIFYWNSDKLDLSLSQKELGEIIKHNSALARKRFCLSEDEIKAIIESNQ